MRDVIAGVAIVLLLALIAGIPLAITTVLARRSRAAFAAVEAWASSHGWQRSASSAMPAELASILPSVSYAVDGGVLTVSISEHRSTTHVSFYHRPSAPPRGPTFSLCRNTFGAPGRAVTRDLAFDAQFLVTAADDASACAHLTPAVRDHLLRHSIESSALSFHEGTLAYTQVDTRDDVAAWGRALTLLRQMARPTDAVG